MRREPPSKSKSVLENALHMIVGRYLFTLNFLLNLFFIHVVRVLQGVFSIFARIHGDELLFEKCNSFYLYFEDMRISGYDSSEKSMDDITLMINFTLELFFDLLFVYMVWIF